MERRDLFRALGTAAAFTLLPRTSHAAWEIVVSSPGAAPRALTDDRSALVAALADAIIPRTDTPGATDVGVPAFVDVIIAEYYNDAERARFLSGLDAIGASAKRGGAASFAALTPDAQKSLLDSLDDPSPRRLVKPLLELADRFDIHVAPQVHAWARLKGLVIHGYFTSEQVQKEVLKTEIMPGRFDGDAPMKSAAGASN